MGGVKHAEVVHARILEPDSCKTNQPNKVFEIKCFKVSVTLNKQSAGN
jgi:hypothetical protein